MNKTVSIIIPSYNKFAFVSETIRSVLNQSYTEWELLVVDDNSTDNSWRIIQEFAQNDSRIFNLKNTSGRKGASVCRNIGLHKAKSEYIIFLDADDLLDADCLKNRIAEMVNYPGLDFMVFPMGTFYHQIGDSKSIWIPGKGNHLKQFLMHKLPWQTMQPIWNKKFLLKINGFDEMYPRLQDVELHSRALLEEVSEYRISKSKSPDCYYRITEDRKIDNPGQFYVNWVDSLEIYIRKTSELLIVKGLPKETLLLKGTLIRGLTTLLYATQKKELNPGDSNRLINRLLELSKEKYNGNNYLKLYIKLYKMGFYHIKGFNYIFQTFITKS